MPTAAIPSYLGRDFKDASPALRFGLLLPIWTTRQDQEADVHSRAEKRSGEGREVASILRRDGMDATIRQLCQRERNPLPGLWYKNDFAARNTWQNIKTLTKADQERMNALAKRQSALEGVFPSGGILCIPAVSVAPFTTGLGNEHPLENGFAFLNPYGLPYLPGSGIKGVLRQAARELCSGEWGDNRGWDKDERYTLVLGKDKQIDLDLLDVLFGKESKDGDTDHLRGVLSIWDVIPQINGDSLMVEIMTPHQSHYYQWKKDQRGNLIEVSPHDSGQPTPISFLTVPPDSGFTFHVTCDLVRLQRLAQSLTENDQTGKPRWKTLLEAAFHHAFDWLGFGAKTAVGYGAMGEDPTVKERREPEAREAEKQRRRAVEEAERQEALARMTPAERAMREFLDARQDKNQPELNGLINALKAGEWSGEIKTEIAGHVKAMMEKAGKWKESSQAKRPERDKDYQNTLLVIGWLKGK